MGAAFYDNGIQPKTTSHYIYRVQRKFTISKIYSLSPLRYHQSPHGCSHILRGGTFLLFSCRALSVIGQVQRSWTRAPTPKNLSPKDV